MLLQNWSLQMDFTVDALTESWENKPLISFETLKNYKLIFSPFDFDDNFDTPLHDVDPDIQF